MKCFVLALAIVLLGANPAAAQDLTLLTEILPPLQMERDGRLSGLSVEAVREAMRRMGLDLPIEAMPWARGYRRLLRGPNVALFSTARTPQREVMFKWAGPLASLQWVLYAKKGRNISIRSLDDARRVERIGTCRDDAREEYLRSLGFTNLESVENDGLNVLKLMKGRVDLMAGLDVGAASAARAVGADPDELVPVYVLRTFDLYLAFSGDVREKEAARWNEALDAMRRDGFMERLRDRWLR